MLPANQQWHTSQIKQYERQYKQALLTDESTLASFSEDFGKLVHASPSAVFNPENTEALQSLIFFANQHQLPITIRGKGLSQSGQSLPVDGGLTISMSHFDKTLEMEDSSIWVEANATWSDILHKTIAQNLAPFIVPYNCNLSIGGVLSVGGIGGSSFKYGAINAHVDALEVVDSFGNIHKVDNKSPLFASCLSGQGLFGVITKAKIQLRPVKSRVKTFYLVYTDEVQWFSDMNAVHDSVDYMEVFCSPSIQGAVLHGDKRLPMAQWLFALHLSIEYEDKAPKLEELLSCIKPWKVLHTQEEPLLSYLLRHDSRFDLMKRLGQWDLMHPWYESFVPAGALELHLKNLLQKLPLHYANLVHIALVANHTGGFLMLPPGEWVYSVMILNPGIPVLLKDSCLDTIQALDTLLIPLGSKRYLSGFLGSHISNSYWSQHFGPHYQEWLERKRALDPVGIFTSALYSGK